MYYELEQAGLICGTEEHKARYRLEAQDSAEERRKVLPPTKAMQDPQKNR